MSVLLPANHVFRQYICVVITTFIKYISIKKNKIYGEERLFSKYFG